MTQLPGFIDQDNPSHVYKLKNATYGLKQASQTWYHELYSFCINFGFKNSHIYTFLFVADIDGHIMNLLFYINDLIFTNDN